MQAVSCLIFRLYDLNDQPLFVGITQNWPQARRHLARQFHWFADVWRTELEPCRTLPAAMVREQALLRDLAPRYRTLPPPAQSDPGAAGDWLSVREAARELGVSSGRIRQWLENGAVQASETAEGLRIYRGALAPLRRREVVLDHGA
jgi:excisionase family DNA binding protein